MMFAFVRSPKYWLLTLLGIALLTLPFFASRQYTHLVLSLMPLAVGSVALRLLYLSGRLTVGQNFFLLTGAYGVAFLTLKLGLNPWLAMLASMAVSVMLAFLLGLILLRVPGVYFAIATLALVLVATSALVSSPGLTGGYQGLTDIPGLTIGSFQFATDPSIASYYYTIMAMGILGLGVMYRMEHSPLGFLIRSLGGNDELAEHLGVSSFRYRMLVFCVGAAFCGLAGGFSATYLRLASPDGFGLATGLYLQIYAVVGGLSVFVGPIIGVLFIEGLVSSLGWAKYAQPIVYGAILLFFFLLFRDGLAGIPGMIRSRVRSIRGGESRTAIQGADVAETRAR